VDLDLRNVEVVTFDCPVMNYSEVTINGEPLSQSMKSVRDALVNNPSPGTYVGTIASNNVECTSLTTQNASFFTIGANLTASYVTATDLDVLDPSTANKTLLLASSNTNGVIDLAKNSATNNGINLSFQTSTQTLSMGLKGSSPAQLTFPNVANVVNCNVDFKIDEILTVPRVIKTPTVTVTGASAVDIGTFSYPGIRQCNVNFRNVTSTTLPYLQVAGAGGWYAATPTYDLAYKGCTTADTNERQWVGTGIPLWDSGTVTSYNLSGSLELTWMGGTTEKWSVRGMLVNTSLGAGNFAFSFIQGMITCTNTAVSPTLTNIRATLLTGTFTGGVLFGLTF
jgi:hypothetical protein